MFSPSDVLNGKLLIVDDQQASVSVLEGMLRGAGYTSVASTLDPHQVCELYRENRYDLILLDLLMPGMDGFEVLHGLTEVETEGYLPVLVVTAEPSHKLRALQAGAKDFISKPFDQVEVLTRIRNMLEVRLLLRESRKHGQFAQEARAAAEAANGLKDEFLATLSHELRTPLTAIIGWAHLLDRGKLAPDETARAVDTIIRNAKAQNQMIEELLDVSRIITGKLQLELQPVDIATVVKAVIGTVTPAANAKGIRIQLIQNPAGSCMMGDPERLQQVLWNLFSNAIKFTPKNGRVRVSVESVGSSVEVVVADTGLGIDAEFLPHVFDRFTQNDSSSTRPARGLGLGLSIARQLVELHGGSIRAESPGVGHGSTFTARFPGSAVTAVLLEPRSHSRADEVVRLPDGPDLTGIRVLVVEDDDDARCLVETVLADRGATVKAVASAREGLDVLGADPVDVLVSDIGMPGTDGYQLIKELRLRSAEQGGAVPAAALTAYARTEDRWRALGAGFQLHLAKPVLPSELLTVVASLAARRNA